MKHNYLKIVVGADVAMDKINIAIVAIDQNIQCHKLHSTQIENNFDGFKKALKIVQKIQAKYAVNMLWTCEATGVYHEDFVYFLADNQQEIAIINPKQIKDFIKSLGQKSKTDDLDAIAIARFGLTQNPILWQPPALYIRQLRGLFRERLQVVAERVRVDNRIHALEHSKNASKSTLKRLKAQLNLLKKQEKEIELEAKNLIKQYPELAEKMAKLQQIKGVGFITVWAVVSETGGFSTTNNVGQLTSYAGLDIRLHESGKYAGQTKISRQGNANLRSALFMSAMSAGRDANTKLGSFAKRIRGKSRYYHMGTIAVARKLLIIMKSLWESGADYQETAKETSLETVDVLEESVSEHSIIITDLEVVVEADGGVVCVVADAIVGLLLPSKIEIEKPEERINPSRLPYAR